MASQNGSLLSRRVTINTDDGENPAPRKVSLPAADVSVRRGHLALSQIAHQESGKNFFIAAAPGSPAPKLPDNENRVRRISKKASIHSAAVHGTAGELSRRSSFLRSALQVEEIITRKSLRQSQAHLEALVSDQPSAAKYTMGMGDGLPRPPPSVRQNPGVRPSAFAQSAAKRSSSKGRDVTSDPGRSDLDGEPNTAVPVTLGQILSSPGGGGGAHSAHPRAIATESRDSGPGARATPRSAGGLFGRFRRDSGQGRVHPESSAAHAGASQPKKHRFGFFWCFKSSPTVHQAS